MRLTRQFLGLKAIKQIKKAKQSTKRQDSQILSDFGSSRNPQYVRATPNFLLLDNVLFSAAIHC